MPLDIIDKSILNRIQSDFPIDARPYAAIARDLDLDEAQVLDRVKALKAAGIIRRIGGNLVPPQNRFCFHPLRRQGTPGKNR